MSENNELKKTGFTKTGFSDSFSCCSRFSICEMGKKECWYHESDPLVQQACRAWVRHHKVKNDYSTLLIIPTTNKFEDHKEIKSEAEPLLQLSLFD
ncbi:hypothetical protein [Cytobacillus gottheilii]|uniref:hypothetical protein n=1 Tax=Cytobacillus gottheilii TaxID=859144 RepID=UPI0024942C00|nr:hypothetical protein [Cytobacillus gottheilii]